MKRAILILLVIAGVLAARVAAYPATAKVMLKDEAEVTPMKSVTVGDIASITAPKELASKIGEITVGTGPMPGQNKNVAASYIRVKLKSAKLDKGVTLTGPDTVSITGKCLKLSSEELAEEAKTFLTNQLPNGNATYDVVIDRLPREIILPETSDVTISPRLMSSSVRPGVNTVVLNIMSGNKSLMTTSAVLTVKAVSDVMVATCNIRQGEVLTQTNTTWEQRDITNMRDISVRSGDEQPDWVAKRTIQAGSVITASSVEVPPTVKRGDTISVVVKCGNVTLHTTAQAKQDGRIGETIRVLPAVSQSEVRAKIIEPGLVEIKR